MNLWMRGSLEPETGETALLSAIMRVTKPVFAIDYGSEIGIAHDGIMAVECALHSDTESVRLLAYVPQLNPCDMGDARFKKTYGLRYAYIAGAMANGITSVRMVEAVGRAGMIGFFGSAGLSLNEVEAAIHTLQERMNGYPFGFNLIHSPNEPELEQAIVDLYIRRGIRVISASAYANLTLPVVYYRLNGIHRKPDGQIVCPNKILAKVSRIEVAEKFFSPPPEKILSQLIEKRMITAEEAILARSVSMAEDLTAEADSGGHTDNRPAISLFPTMVALRDELVRKYKYPVPPCVGLGGGIATPEATAAAFAMGAAYVLTGSINQSCMEAGTSEIVRNMLAQARQADVMMAPAADMFELGVKVQVLKRGTMFALRANRLYELYCRYDSIESLPEKERLTLERDYFRCSMDDAWNRTRKFFEKRDPKQIARAEKNPKHRMALVFRSYLGLSSKWAISGDTERQIDYQIWCGPAIGAFNEWVKGTFLEKPENRETVTVAMNLLMGASVLTRINWLRHQGVALPVNIGRFSPMKLSEIYELIK